MAYIPDWSEADYSGEQDYGPDPAWYDPVWSDASRRYQQRIGLRGAVEDRARSARLAEGTGSNFDIATNIAGLPIRLAAGIPNIPSSIYSR